MPFNLVRMGLANSKGPAIFSSPKFDSTWSLLNSSDIKQIYSRMVTQLQDLPYGPFIFVSSLVGLPMAQDLSRKGEMVERVLGKRRAESTALGSQSKKVCS